MQKRPKMAVYEFWLIWGPHQSETNISSRWTNGVYHLPALFIICSSLQLWWFICGMSTITFGNYIVTTSCFCILAQRVGAGAPQEPAPFFVFCRKNSLPLPHLPPPVRHSCPHLCTVLVRIVWFACRTSASPFILSGPSSADLWTFGGACNAAGTPHRSFDCLPPWHWHACRMVAVQCTDRVVPTPPCWLVYPPRLPGVHPELPQVPEPCRLPIKMRTILSCICMIPLGGRRPKSPRKVFETAVFYLEMMLHRF